MDRVTVVALVLIGAALAHGLYASTSGCSYSSVEATEEGQPPAVVHCEERYSPVPFVLLAFMALAGIGVWTRQLALAWAGAIPALGGCIILGLSWGGVLIFHAVAVTAAVAVWHRWGRRPAASQVSRRAFAAIFSIPLGLLALVNLGYGVPALFDPCVQWDHSNTIEMSADDPCRSKTSYGQTKAEYVTELVTQSLLALTAASLAGVGAWKRNSTLLATAGALWCIQAVVLVLGFGYPLVPLAVAAAVACFLAAKRSPGEAAPPAASLNG